jgi:hypothetical protein
MLRRAGIGWLAGLETRTGRHWSWTGLLIVELSLLGAPWTQADSGGQASAWALYGIYGSVALSLLVPPHVREVKTFLS